MRLALAILSHSLFLVLFAHDSKGLEHVRRNKVSEPGGNPTLSDGSEEDPNWSLRLEAHPGVDLVNGNPHHWQYTKPGKPVHVLIMRGRWPETGREEIPIEGNLNHSMEDTRHFFLDSSWGAIAYDYTYSPVIDFPTPAVSSTASSIKDESLAENAKNGYIWCGGPCGTNLADSKWQNPDQTSDRNSSLFDMAVVVHRSDPPSLPGWAGLGVIGAAFTWTKYPTSGALLEHEIGHNYGMSHHRTHKDRDGEAYNNPQHTGFSRMAAGGAVSFDDQKTRYNTNGHFGAANKHWFGWLIDRDVVFLHPDGAAECSACRTSWSGKLNAFDRPDVVPGQEPSPYFAAKIPVGTTGNEVIYVQYRSSYPSSRKGILVQWCTRSFGMDSGMTGVCYTHDAFGDSYTFDDSAIVPGTSYVVWPSHPLVERIGLEEAMKVVPVITVSSVPDLDADPDCPDLICNYDKEIAAELSIRFLTEEEKQRRNVNGIPAAQTLVLAPGEPQAVASPGKVLVVGEDTAQGAGGKGELNVSVCPDFATDKADVYFYDDFPLAPGVLGSPMGYGALEKHSVFATDCCERGSLLPANGVRVVVVKQNEAQVLNVAEIAIYAAADSGTNIALTGAATCYMLPSTGWYYIGDEGTGESAEMTDGDPDTYGHSGWPDDCCGKNYAMCVLTVPTVLHSVRIVPRSNMDWRSKSFTLEVYAGVGMEDRNDYGPMRPVGRLWHRLVEHSGDWYNSGTGELYSIPAEAQTNTNFQCEDRSAGGPMTVRYPAVHGKAFAIVDAAGGVQVGSSVNFGICPGATSDYSFDHSFATAAANGAQSCKPCPSLTLARTGMEACPSDMLCDILSVPGGGLFQRRGTVNGRQAYTGRGQAKIMWDPALGAGRWSMVDADGLVIGTKDSAGFDEHWKAAGSPEERFQGVRAVVVTQNQETVHNVCEIELYDRNGVNIAPSKATCWNLPGNQPGQWYSADPKADGTERKLNDGDRDNCAHTGDGTVLGRKMVCVLAEPTELSRIYVAPNPWWRGRINNVNLTLFDHIPDDFPPTMATFSGPYSVELEAEDMGWGGDYSLCSLPFANRWAVNEAVLAPQCAETQNWEVLGEYEAEGRMRTGGLGLLMEPEKFEVWACVYNHTCAQLIGPAEPPVHDRETFAGSDGTYGTGDDIAWADWMCYVFDEEAQQFLAWGFNSELRLFDPSRRPDM